MNVVNTRISQRYDTLQNWQQRNPTLLEGELAVVATDNQTRFKIGDGQHAFNDLNFVDQLKLTTVSAFANILSVNCAAVGFQNEASTHSLAAGTDTSAAGQHAVALGYKAAASSNGAFVFNGDQNYLAQPYYDHGAGTFNVNAPLSDVYIADNDIKTALSTEGFVLSTAIPTDLSDLTNGPGYLVSNDISDYYKKSETSSSAEISTAFQLSAGNKVFIDDRISNISEQADLSVIKLSSDEYGQIIDDVLSNAIYIVEDNYNNAFGAQMKNLAPGTDLSDAVNLEQLNAVSSSVPTKVSQLENDAGYTTNVGTITGITMNGVSKGTSGVVNLGTVLTAHQSLANYYQKSETSSANEISTALENAGGGSSRYALVTAQLVSDNGSLTCAVDDQTITTIQVSSSATPIVVQLPTQSEDGARDFILRIEISSSAAPTFTFNGVTETIDFDSEDDDWAVMEPGLNLVSFTETKRGDGSSSGNGGGGSNVVYHTVTFDPGSYASLANPSDATRQVADGEAVGTLPAVTADSSVFRGWYTEQNGFGTQVTESTVITANVTFYAYIRQTSG